MENHEEIRELIEKHWQEIQRVRCHIHAYPELSHEEEKTAEYIAAELRKLGLKPREHVGGHGVTAVIEGSGEGPCVGLRADIDALPITENTGLSFASQNPGVMHACGHDTHAAMLLGAALVLNEMKDHFPGKVKLIFQPSEEDATGSGAKAMIADGVLEYPKVDYMFGQHVWPALPTGVVGVRNGAMMAASDRFFITIKGKNSHGSQPQEGIDAIVIAAQVVSALQSIISRRVGPLDSAVVSIGTVHGGNRYNVIADEVKLEGTCRNLNPEVRDLMPERIGNIVEGVAKGMGGDCEFRYVRCYSPTINDPKLFRVVRASVEESLGKEALVIPEHSALGGEDFSFYCEKVPSAFFWLGCHKEGTPYYPIHHGSFVPDLEALPKGVEVMVTSALKVLKGEWPEERREE